MQLDLATNCKTASDATANSPRSKLASALRTISSAAVVEGFGFWSGKDVRVEFLQPFPGASVCEWKGTAKYWGLKSLAPSRQAIGWSYPTAQSPYEPITGYFSFYPGRIECSVDNERVRPQPGFFYGGWVTDEIVGPWKGEPGTERW